MAHTRRSLLYVVGTDPLMLQAVATDLPDARVRRFRSLATSLPASAAAPPDLVLIGPDVSQVEAERAAARRWWGGRPVVVEMIAGRPLALLWLGAEMVRVVEMEPGFLSPFLLRDLEAPPTALHWRPVRGWQRIAHAAAALLIMAVLTSVAFGGWTHFDDRASFDADASSTVLLDDPSRRPSVEPACAENEC